jgi:hypothetical protein
MAPSVEHPAGLTGMIPSTADPRLRGRRRQDGAQLRRQAAFLAAYDPAADTAAWLAHLPAANPRPGEWSPEWVAARSRAVTEAARGNPTCCAGSSITG